VTFEMLSKINMSIQSKIEEIRKQPEHVRMRYVLLSVFVSMLFISVLWVFSITTSFKNSSDVTSVPVVVPEKSSQAVPNTPDANPVPKDDNSPSLNEWIKK
jgi:cytoskeletal protein RodZ